MKNIIFFILILITNIVFAEENTNIFEIVKSNNKEAAGYLEKVKDVNIKDQFGCDIFIYALANRNFALAEKILGKGYDINNKDIYGNSLLRNIILMNDFEIIKFLIDNKIDINIKNNSGNTVLHLASQSDPYIFLFHPHFLFNRLFISRIIIANKIKSKLDDRKNLLNNNLVKENMNPFLNTILSNNIEGVKLLVKKIKDINHTDIYGMTYLDWAVLFKRDKIKEILKQKGANSREINLNIDQVFYKENINIYKYLLEKGADVNAVNKDKMAPIHIVSHYLDIQKLKLLIDYKVNINNYKKKWMFSPMHIVSHSILPNPKRNEFLKILLENGANPEEPQYYIKNDKEVKNFKKPDEYNLKIIINETAIDEPEKDLRSFYKIFIDKEEKGRTNVALESQYKEYTTKLNLNKHLIKIVKYRLDRGKGKYVKLNNIDQPKPNYIYFEIPQDKIVLIKINNDKKANKCEYKIDFELE